MRIVVLIGIIFSLISGYVYAMEEGNQLYIAGKDHDTSSFNIPSVIQEMKDAIVAGIKKDVGKKKDDSLGPCDYCAEICCCHPIKKFARFAYERNKRDDRETIYNSDERNRTKQGRDTISEGVTYVASCSSVFALFLCNPIVGLSTIVGCLWAEGQYKKELDRLEKENPVLPVTMDDCKDN